MIIKVKKRLPVRCGVRKLRRRSLGDGDGPPAPVSAGQLTTLKVKGVAPESCRRCLEFYIILSALIFTEHLHKSHLDK